MLAQKESCRPQCIQLIKQKIWQALLLGHLLQKVYTALCIPGSAPPRTSLYILSTNFPALISEIIQAWHIYIRCKYIGHDLAKIQTTSLAPLLWPIFARVIPGWVNPIKILEITVARTYRLNVTNQQCQSTKQNSRHCIQTDRITNWLSSSLQPLTLREGKTVSLC